MAECVLLREYWSTSACFYRGSTFHYSRRINSPNTDCSDQTKLSCKPEKVEIISKNNSVRRDIGAMTCSESLTEASQKYSRVSFSVAFASSGVSVRFNALVVVSGVAHVEVATFF